MTTYSSAVTCPTHGVEHHPDPLQEALWTAFTAVIDRELAVPQRTPYDDVPDLFKPGKQP